MGSSLGTSRGMAPITIFTTDYCSYCRAAKTLLAREGIAYREVDVSQDAAQRAWLLERTGRRTVPQIFIGDDAIGGFDELMSLSKSGALHRRIDAIESLEAQR